MAIPTQFAYRTLKGIGILDAAPVYQPLPGFKRPEGNSRCCTYSPCGRYFAWASNDGVNVVRSSDGHVITSLPAPNVYELGFSPRGTYIITWERPSKDENGDAVKNLKIWRTVEDVPEGAEKEVVGRFVQKSQTGWNLQYTFDEKYCARNVTNEVQFYESGDLPVFVPERKGQPSAVKVFNVPQFNAPVSQKTFFKGDKVQLKWNQLGTTLIVLAQTDVDKSNKKLLSTRKAQFMMFHGHQTSKEFGGVYGYMPAKTTIFNQRAVATHTFQLGPRNTILFSPTGRFVLVAGFGNLAGQMDIYDLEKDYKTVQSKVETLVPRLRVDNGVRLWHVTGGIMYNEDMVELYHVTWRPQRPESFPAGDFMNPVPQPHPSAVAYLGTVKTPSKPAGAYRPPGARGQATPSHFKREDEGGSAHFVSNGTSMVNTNGFGRSRRQVPGADLSENSVPGASVPGAEDENLSKAALKNKKKREAKKLKDAEAKASGLGAGTSDAPRGPGGDRSPDRRDRQRSRSKSNNIRSPSQHRTHGNGGPHNLHQHPHPHQNQRQNGGAFPSGGSAAHGGIKNLVNQL
ncbi:hypothetical protein DID88_001648 [Monilinia fructigena]|uniref:Eukaryotic translation initiation factor 2A n=1 Tax=Monilinia fructigena TaxID=38457 RepID=A0A395IWD8_9HELO|nr:hypothetical protein DID88_001648 [Monilinia fructigena]